jgi:serine/threonine protein kinase/DNA-binding winged helix-turn-helix (wHTH) protein
MGVDPSAIDSAQANAGHSRVWHFGSAVLDERTLELRIGETHVDVERRPLDVLLHLLRHADEVVTKDELLAAVWPGRILTETVLTKCVGRLRDVLEDRDQTVIKTVYGYGYRLITPVRVEFNRAPPALRFDFSPGDHPPLRPLWGLVQRLGIGGHGEAWLARHAKTHEARVFKFAVDTSSLEALKREITLYRLLHDSLGDQAMIVPVLDWNLDHQPFFIESTHVPGGNLSEWLDRRGGAQSVGLPERLEIAARIADALASVHSVGVLHKDLKPSNILLTESALGSVPEIRLADFGSGAMLDVHRLESLGITRLGFTKSVAFGVEASGTPQYLAPEVMAGQPPTIRADIYALGVILYQLIVGDLRKSISPGWERDLDDELLREDVARAAEGDPVRRLSDASELAVGLRTLTERRAHRVAQLEAQTRAERAALDLDRLRARRSGMRWAFAAVTIGLVVSAALYVDARNSRRRAESEAHRAQATSDFLTQGVLATINSHQRPVKNLTVKELLDAAAQDAGRRFADQPDVAANVYESLGASYDALDDIYDAEINIERALQLHERADGPAAERTLGLAAKLVRLKFPVGELPAAIDHYQEIEHAGEMRLGSEHPLVRELRVALAAGRVQLGEWSRGAAELEAVYKQIQAKRAPDIQFVTSLEMSLGFVLIELARYQEAEQVLRSAVQHVKAQYGDDHIDLARANSRLGRIMLETGRYAESAKILDQALIVARKWTREEGTVIRTIRIFQARLNMEQGNAANAIPILEEVLSAVEGPGKERLDGSFAVNRPLAEAYQRLGRLTDAALTMQTALASSEASLGNGHPTTREIRTGLVDILREQGLHSEARRLLMDDRPLAFDDLPPEHPARAALHRVQGLLFLEEHDPIRARTELADAQRIYSISLGSDNWETRRSILEFQQAIATPTVPKTIGEGNGKTR